MKVVLDDDVFGEEACLQSRLIDIISFGYYQKHDIITDPILNENLKPEKGTNLERWLNEQREELKKEVMFTLRMGINEGLAEPLSKESIYVTPNTESNWNTSPPEVSTKDASKLLSKSLHLLVENSRSDGQFVKTMIKRILGRSYWKPLKKALNNHWLHIENGGGVGNMRKIICEITDDPIRRKRTSAVFDSDAPAPGEPSEHSEALKVKCQEHGIDCQQLKRRAIENYLPRKALKAAVSCGSETPSPDQEMVDIFCSLTRDQRHHFHMKKGFEDEEIYEDPPDLFSTLDEADRITLNGGFSKDIADIFCEEDFEIKKEWVEKDYKREDKEEFENIFNIVVSKI